MEVAVAAVRAVVEAEAAITAAERTTREAEVAGVDVGVIGAVQTALRRADQEEHPRSLVGCQAGDWEFGLACTGGTVAEDPVDVI
ncbi:hypothetical protein MLD38_036155 [Melastoma candidum]|uniref:Uncharacterized protein n=1 Tax=Melastoma candidum TaxID=119954 RepID=A0ACB9LIT4_9MYRT|nr:hypothetical protein MLD38_036155 [Melastoma candidum]